MKPIFALCLVFLTLNISAQNDKLLLELGVTGEKLNASRYSVSDKYNANYTVNDLGHGFVLSFDRTYAFFNNEMELQWKATLPKYVKQGPTPIVLGDEKKTYIIDFSPSFLAFNSMEVKEINNENGVVETYELVWKGNEKYFADYNLHNGVISILFVNDMPNHVYRLMTVENKKLTETTLNLPHDETDLQVSLVPVYKGDNKSGDVMNLISQYTYDDKKSKKKVVVYKTITLSPQGKIISASKRKEWDVTALDNLLWYSKEPLQIVDVDGQRYFTAQTHQKGAPKGWVLGTISDAGEFKIVTQHLAPAGASSPPRLTYIASSQVFVFESFNFVGVRSGKLYRSFFHINGKVICDDNIDIDPNLYYNFSLSTYENRISSSNCDVFPPNLSYYNIIEEYTKKTYKLPINFNALARGNGHIFITIDPNSGRVTGRKIDY